MSINPGGGGRPGRTNLRAEAHGKAKKQHQKKQYDQHKYDGCDPDNLEAMPV
jgi:hypothetical protein